MWPPRSTWRSPPTSSRITRRRSRSPSSLPRSSRVSEEGIMTRSESTTPASDRIELSLRCADCGQELDTRALSRTELEAQAVAQLPDREAMSLVNANLAVPINLAAALNVLSDSSTAGALAQQQTPIVQGI